MFATLVKLVMMPLTVLIIVKLLGFNTGPEYVISVMQAAMPTAVTALAIADEFDLDVQFSSTVIIISTLLSLPVSLIWMGILAS